jgi:hypothetical protein
MRHLALTVLLSTALISRVSAAQDPTHAPDGGTSFTVSGVELLNIPGIPLIGKSSITWTRPLPDGSTVSTHLEANLARDSQGRIYRERRSFVPENSNLAPRLTMIYIFDPVARTDTTCTVATHECVITNFHPWGVTSLAAQPVGLFANGTRYLTRENLGTNVMDGLDVVGTRETVTINPGVVGNDRPLVSTREFWYAESLKTNLVVTRNDPREGKQVIRLIDFSKSEPNPELFSPPPGYVIRDARTPAQTER